ncbi:MAG: pilus assembly protein [Anaerosomatales bacterium]|nr:pilus assembly protein [Anaerosomatales bacterium]
MAQGVVMFSAMHAARRDDGASAVEFALVAMILVLFLLGITQFGVNFYQWIELEHAAREGVRWAALCNPDDDTKARVIAAAPGIDIDPADITIEPSNPTAAMAGLPVEVSVTYESPVFTPLMQAFFGGEDAITLTASATQKIE